MMKGDFFGSLHSTHVAVRWELGQDVGMFGLCPLANRGLVGRTMTGLAFGFSVTT